MKIGLPIEEVIGNDSHVKIVRNLGFEKGSYLFLRASVTQLAP